MPNIFTGNIFGSCEGGGGTALAGSEDIRFYYTVATGPGLDLPQSNPYNSLGGFASHTVWTATETNDLFNNVGLTNNTLGSDQYRCIILANINEDDLETGPLLLYIDDNSDAYDLKIGLDPVGVVNTNSSSAQAATIINDTTAPSGVTFADATDGISIPSIAAGKCIAIWFNREIDAAATDFTTSMFLRLESDE